VVRLTRHGTLSMSRAVCKMGGSWAWNLLGAGMGLVLVEGSSISLRNELCEFYFVLL
jgi:hypothetical protein